MNLFALGVLVLSTVNEIFCQADDLTSVSTQIKTGKVEIKINSNRIFINIRKNAGTSVNSVLYVRNSTSEKPELLEIKENCETFTTCILSNNVTHTKIRADPEAEVISVKRILNNPNGQITDCYQLGNSAVQWFSGPQMRYQHWPIQSMYYEEEPYVPTHPQNMAVTERYWLTSIGIYIYVDEKDPLFLDQNNYKDKHLCLVAKNKAPYMRREAVTLTYEIGVFDDPKQAHEHVIEKHFDKPTGHPNERMVTHPIWSTWARYKVNVSDKVIRDFADEILKYGFNNSQIEIDDNWETCYGSAVFDPKKFPDVKKLTADLKQKMFRVTLWIHPFINEDCKESYDFALKNNYLVKNLNGSAHTTWWQGTNGAGAIDFTNPKAVEWWVGRLKDLEKLGIDSFKFDAGEVSWLPQTPKLSGSQDLHPGIYTLNYTTNLAKHFDDNIEVRVGWRSQNLPVFVRMIDKDTRWTWNNGIPTLITTLLQMNLNGYMFVLPDMIGGNGYVENSFNATELPSKDIFIRWLQANVFMPSLQYSFVPWDFDNQTIAICKKFTDLHASISPTIMELFKNAVKTGAPVNKPVWWVDPANTLAHPINDEFLLGDDILVAPVIEENAVSRNIYLPDGDWKDANTGSTYLGPILLNDYSAPLDVLPYFYRQRKPT